MRLRSFSHLILSLDYEQQRQELMHKHGIDLDDGAGLTEGAKTRRMNRREVDRLMGGQNGEGVFTWRDKNRKKVHLVESHPQFAALI